MIEDIVNHFLENKRITEHQGNSKGYALYTLDSQLKGQPIFIFKRKFNELIRRAKRNKSKQTNSEKYIQVELNRAYDNQLTEDVVLFYKGTAHINLDLSAKEPKLNVSCTGEAKWY